MDIVKYFAVGHEHHVVCNPTSEAKLDELIELLRPPPGARLLDVACGKAEYLVRAARRWGAAGVGVELSADFAASARRRVGDAGLEGRVEILEQDGRDYAAPARSFDVASCLGASWIWSGHAGTLAALSALAKPGGSVVVGEPFWHGEPPRDYLEASGLAREAFGSHRANVQAGLDAGLRFLHALVSSDDDWDRYEGYQSYAIERHAAEHPEDPDLPDLLRLMERNRDLYLRWGRAELGWAIYLFRKPG